MKKPHKWNLEDAIVAIVGPSLPPALEEIAREMDAYCPCVTGTECAPAMPLRPSLLWHCVCACDHEMADSACIECKECHDCLWPGHAKAREMVRKAAEWKEKALEAWMLGKEPQR